MLALTGCSQGSSAVTGSWGDTTSPSQPSLELESNGKLSGTDGCNRLMGSYTVSGNEVTFTGVASTLMYCEGVDTWLSQLATAQVDGDTMTVLDEAGAEIGTLER